MTQNPARPEGFGYEYVPAMDSPRGKTEPNWRVSDAQDNRIATCYDEAHCRLIVAALNGAPIVKDPTSVDMVREHAARLADMAKRNGGPAGAELAGIAAILATAARRLAGDEPPTKVVEVRREGSLESDPYAARGVTFADVVEVLYNLDNKMALAVVVNRRIFDDVHAAHRMLDGLWMPGGLLTERIGHMILAAGSKFTISGPKVEGTINPEDVLRSAHAIARRDARRDVRRRARGPVADVDDVQIPEPDRVLELLDRLSGEELFRLFDSVKVLPANTLEARDWNLMDTADVRRMIATCCAIALETGRLGELAKAAVEIIDKKGGA